jgi:sulfur transfer complex TusBCD TusB component (DsrH family)
LCFAKRAADADTDSEHQDSHPENNPGTSDCVLSCLHEEDGVGATINHKKHLNTCANSSSAQTYYIASDTHARGLNLECAKQLWTWAVLWIHNLRHKAIQVVTKMNFRRLHRTVSYKHY